MILSRARLGAVAARVCLIAFAFSGSIGLGHLCALAADKDKPADSPLPPKKMKALAAIRKELPPKSEYYTFLSADLDGALNVELRKLGRVPSAPVGDEIFVRRAYLDVTGKLPPPNVVRDFVADSEAKKRNNLIDRLLDTDDYARHWARYWRDVMLYNNTTDRKKYNKEALEN